MKKEELIKENERLKAGLEYILLLANKKNPHLGRPRYNTDCIFCMVFFLLKYNAYGVRIEEDDFINLTKELKQG